MMTAVPHARRTTERLSAFSDGVFAVLITVLVLDLRPPEFPTFKSLLSLWPTWLSYAVSYLFIAIVWTNHHHLMRYATQATPRLMWFNFAHLFSVSLLPLSAAWMAVSELAPQPVAFYAAVFFLVNATYFCLIYELIDRASVDDVLPRERRIMHFRSITTLCVFAAAAGRGIEISADWTRNVYLLSGRLSKTRSAGSEEVKVRGVPAALLARAEEGSRISHYFAAVRETACGTKRTLANFPVTHNYASTR
jgi:uncharacterized membrane protein